MNIQEQLAYLRQTVARIDQKYAGSSGDAPAPAPKPGVFVEELLSGEVIETPHGRHFETEKLYPHHQRHGSYEISDLIALQPDMLEALSDGAIRLVDQRRRPRTRLAFPLLSLRASYWSEGLPPRYVHTYCWWRLW